MPLSEQNKEWLDNFREKYGRMPRVLHIGNIANNAYDNAKILNNLGIDCDVICYDYYHIMGCPEWEDADFEGDVKDQFYPAWENTNLQGFKRPKWFVQGPRELCIDYLIAKRRNKGFESGYLWEKLFLTRKAYCAVNRNELMPRCAGFASAIQSLLANIYFLRKWALYYKEKLKRIQNRGNITVNISSPISYFQHSIMFLSLGIFYLAVLFPYIVFRSFYTLRRRTKSRIDISDDYDYEAKIKEVVEAFEKKFPQRECKLTDGELRPYEYSIFTWRKLFKHYDFVIGYATDGIWPLLAGKRPYFAYEHGTIRNIPFLETVQGKLCAITYRNADSVL